MLPKREEEEEERMCLEGRKWQWTVVDGSREVRLI